MVKIAIIILISKRYKLLLDELKINKLFDIKDLYIKPVVYSILIINLCTNIILRFKFEYNYYFATNILTHSLILIILDILIVCTLYYVIYNKYVKDENIQGIESIYLFSDYTTGKYYKEIIMVTGIVYFSILRVGSYKFLSILLLNSKFSLNYDAGEFIYYWIVIYSITIIRYRKLLITRIGNIHNNEPKIDAKWWDVLFVVIIHTGLIFIGAFLKSTRFLINTSTFDGYKELSIYIQFLILELIIVILGFIVVVKLLDIDDIKKSYYHKWETTPTYQPTGNKHGGNSIQEILNEVTSDEPKISKTSLHNDNSYVNISRKQVVKGINSEEINIKEPETVVQSFHDPKVDEHIKNMIENYEEEVTEDIEFTDENEQKMALLNELYRYKKINSYEISKFFNNSEEHIIKLFDLIVLEHPEITNIKEFDSVSLLLSPINSQN